MKFRKLIGALGAAGLLCGVAAQAVQAAEAVSVLHWWTSGGESKAIGVLKDDMTKQGYTWKDFAVAGGAGAAAMTALKTQVISGNAPSAAQIKGPLIQEWADQGVLVPIDSVAGDWKKNLPPEIDKIMHAGGHYVGAPFSVHRVNWLYINKDALDKAGGKVPTTWPEFFAVADKMKANGIVPVAAGGQPWQDLTLWEDVVLSQGADFYKKAIVDLDQKTLTSDQMVGVFDTVRKIETYFDNGRTGRDWNLATAMVINGKAGMQFMGDWAKGEFTSAGKTAGIPYWVWLAMPRLYPEEVHDPGGYAALGMAWEETREMPVGFAKQQVGYIRVSGNCALCHVTTQPTQPDQPPRIVPAVSGKTTDPRRLLMFFQESAADPRFNADELFSEIDKDTSLSLWEKALYRYVLIPRVKKAFLEDPAKALFSPAIRAHWQNPQAPFDDPELKALADYMRRQSHQAAQQP